MVVWEWWIMAIPYRFPSNLAIKSSGSLHDLLFLFNQKTYFKHACQEYNVNSKFFTLFYCTTLKLELHMSIKTKPEILNIPVLPRTRIFILYVVFLWYISVFCSRQLWRFRWHEPKLPPSACFMFFQDLRPTITTRYAHFFTSLELLTNTTKLKKGP